MKTNLLSASSIVTASALVTATVGVAATAIAFTVVGVLAIFATDYRRAIAPVKVPAEAVALSPDSRPMSEMRLAA